MLNHNQKQCNATDTDDIQIAAMFVSEVYFNANAQSQTQCTAKTLMLMPKR